MPNAPPLITRKLWRSASHAGWGRSSLILISAWGGFIAALAIWSAPTSISPLQKICTAGWAWASGSRRWTRNNVDRSGDGVPARGVPAIIKSYDPDCSPIRKRQRCGRIDIPGLRLLGAGKAHVLNQRVSEDFAH